MSKKMKTTENRAKQAKDIYLRMPVNQLIGQIFNEMIEKTRAHNFIKTKGLFPEYQKFKN